MSSVEFAQARMQARFGERPDAASWRELDAIEDLAAYLDALQRTPVRPWIAGIDAPGDLHQIDFRLRERFRAHIREVARWSPPEWRPAVLWLAQLLDLPALAHLLSGEAPLGWMAREPGLRPFTGHLAQGTAPLPDFLRRDPRRGRVRQTAPNAGEARAAWLAEWRRRWPADDAESAQPMRALVARLTLHLEHFRRAGPREAWRARADLERELRSLFRRSVLRPEAAFSYLGLVALDLERLRAQLVRRALRQRARAVA